MKVFPSRRQGIPSILNVFLLLLLVLFRPKQNEIGNEFYTPVTVSPLHRNNND